MARTARKPFEINLRPVIRSLGIEEVIRQAREDRLIDALGRERLIEQIGEKEFIRHFGMDRLVASLSPKELRELKRRLNGAGNSRDE